MMNPAAFQTLCNQICDRLGRDEFDAEAFEMLHSPEFMLTCAWMGLDPEEAGRRLWQIALARRETRPAAVPAVA